MSEAMTGDTIQALKQRLREQARDLNCAAQEFKATVQSLRDLGIGEDAIKELYVELGATVGVGQWLDLNEKAREKEGPKPSILLGTDEPEWLRPPNTGIGYQEDWP